MDYTPTVGAASPGGVLGSSGNYGGVATPQTPRNPLGGRELNSRTEESAARHLSYNVLLDHMEELRSLASGDDDYPAGNRDNMISPAMRSVDESSFYRAYGAGVSEIAGPSASAADPMRIPAQLPMPSQTHLPLGGAMSPPLSDRGGAVPVISVTAGNLPMSQMPSSQSLLYSAGLQQPQPILTQSFSQQSLGGLGLTGLSNQPLGASTPYTTVSQPFFPPQPVYTSTPYGVASVQTPYSPPRHADEDDYDDEEDDDDIEDDDYTEDNRSYNNAGGPRVVDMYSDGRPTPIVAPMPAQPRYSNADYRDAASSARTRNTNAGTERTMVAANAAYAGRSYLTTPVQGYPPQTPGGGRGYPQTPGSRSAVAPALPPAEAERAARYYLKRPHEKPVAWWRKSICHFIGLAMAALCAFWLLNWTFAGLSWSLRSKQISMVVGIEPQTSDPSYQLVNYTFCSPVDSMLGGALAVDYMYGMSREQVVAMVDADQRYVGLFVSKDYSSTLLGRSVPAVVEFIHDSGKNYKTVRDLLFSMILFNEKLRVAIATEFVKQNVSASVGYWLTGPVKLSYTDIHPVVTEGQNIFAYMTVVLLWFGCIFIATITSWMTHPVTPMRATEFGWRMLGAGSMLFLLTIGTTLIPLILNGQFVGVGNSAAGWAATWGWMMFVGISFLGIISLSYQLAGRDLGQALMVVFGFIQFGTCWALLDQNLSMLAYQVGKGFPVYWAVSVLRYIYFGSLSSNIGVAVAVVFSWILAMCSVSILMWFMGWNSVGQNMQRFFSNKIWLGDPKLLGLDDDKTEVYSARE